MGSGALQRPCRERKMRFARSCGHRPCFGSSFGSLTLGRKATKGKTKKGTMEPGLNHYFGGMRASAAPCRCVVPHAAMQCDEAEGRGGKEAPRVAGQRNHCDNTAARPACVAGCRRAFSHSSGPMSDKLPTQARP